MVPMHLINRSAFIFVTDYHFIFYFPSQPRLASCIHICITCYRIQDICIRKLLKITLSKEILEHHFLSTIALQLSISIVGVNLHVYWKLSFFSLIKDSIKVESLINVYY